MESIEDDISDSINMDIKMDDRIQGWTEMAQDRVRRQSLVQERLNLRALLMQCRLINVVERRLAPFLRLWGL